MLYLILMPDLVVLLTMRDHSKVLLYLILLLLLVGEFDGANLVLHLAGCTYLLYNPFFVCIEVVCFVVPVVERLLLLELYVVEVFALRHMSDSLEPG